MSQIVIILCRPEGSGNVGAVCRVMKNMGLSRLRMVSPEYLDEGPLLKRSIHADDVWQSAEFFGSLAEALADCSLAVGTTRRRGRKRKTVTLDPRTLVTRLCEGQFSCEKTTIAFVFGNERTGLEDDELNLCNIASHIPVDDSFPSLNLSHAVQIYAYELFLAFGGIKENPVKGEWVPLERNSAFNLTEEITATLADLGFYQNPGREEQTRFLFDLICRAGLTEREGNYLKDIFIKAARLGNKNNNSV